MANADGYIDIQELGELYRIGEQEFGVTRDQINQAIVENNVPFFKPTSIEGKIDWLYKIAKIAWADGRLDERERKLLIQYVIRYDFPKENAARIADFLLECVEKKISVTDINNQINQL